MDDTDLDAALQDLRLIKSMVAQASASVSSGAPFFLIWGLVWLVGFLLPALGVGAAWLGWSWLALDLAGAAATVVVGMRIRKASRPHPTPYLVRKWWWSLAVLYVAIFGMVPLSPHSGTAAPWVWPFILLIGTWYLMGGILFDSATFIGTGLWLCLLSIIIPLYLPLGIGVQWAVLAVLGGGALILASILVRAEGRRGRRTEPNR